jgi:hypothetical protein
MIRENQDVFKVFCEKFVEFQMQYSYLTLVDSFINYFFDTLTDQASAQKLCYFVYWTTLYTFKYGKQIIKESGNENQKDGGTSE